MGTWGEFTLALKDVASSTVLSLFGENTAVELVMEEDD